MFALTKLAYLKVLQVIISFKIHYSIRLVFFHAKKFSPQNTPFCKELMGGFVENNVVCYLEVGWVSSKKQLNMRLVNSIKKLDEKNR